MTPTEARKTLNDMVDQIDYKEVARKEVVEYHLNAAAQYLFDEEPVPIEDEPAAI